MKYRYSVGVAALASAAAMLWTTAASAQIMRRILIDAARARVSQKRGGAEHINHSAAIDPDELPDISADRSPELDRRKIGGENARRPFGLP